MQPKPFTHPDDVVAQLHVVKRQRLNVEKGKARLLESLKLFQNNLTQRPMQRYFFSSTSSTYACGLLHRAELEERKVLLRVDLAAHDRVAGRRGQTRLVVWRKKTCEWNGKTQKQTLSVCDHGRRLRKSVYFPTHLPAASSR